MRNFIGHIRIQIKVYKKEKKQHEAIWIDENEIASYLNVWNQKLIWERYLDGEFVYSGDGININSGFLDGLKTKEAKEGIIDWLDEKGSGKKAINYKMRDWVFSRQRYWGEPIPLVFCENCKSKVCPEPVERVESQKSKVEDNKFSLGEFLNPGWIENSEEELPVKLPDVENYEPTGTGESPLANISDWVNTKCPKCGGAAKRETNTMPQWAGSCWYYLRYIDPKNDSALIDIEKEKYWMPVDLYVGGAEHATRHLLYARFWHKFLYDIGVVSTKEPFKKLLHVGLILAEGGKKMSKRYGNVVNPDDVVEKFGADSLRLYEMFMGPFNQPVAWSTDGLKGVKRFLDRVWKVITEAIYQKLEAKETDSAILHKTIKKVTEDIENFKFNTAISQLMICFNERDFIPKLNSKNEFEGKEFNLEAVKKFILLLSPFAPHICEELWERITSPNPSLVRRGDDNPPPLQMGARGGESIFTQSWPSYDTALAKDETVELVVQINGKLRDRVEVVPDISEEDAKKLVMERETVKEWVEGKEIVKIIFIKGKLVNIVVR